jgi:hypothetical protein
LLTGVGVEKGTKAVISVNFSVYGRRTFNNLQTNLAAENSLERVFQHPQALTLKTPCSPAADHTLSPIDEFAGVRPETNLAGTGTPDAGSD